MIGWLLLVSELRRRARGERVCGRVRCGEGRDGAERDSCANTIVLTGLDTTATELSVVESVFRLGEGMGPNAINTTHKDTMVESFY